jgi:hypothetical protein
MQQPGLTARPLRRCAARVVSQWVADLENCDRPAVYSALLQLMAEPDACMKVRTCVCVCVCVYVCVCVCCVRVCVAVAVYLNLFCVCVCSYVHVP